MNCRVCDIKMEKLEKDYHFTTSGLDYVYLSGIDHFKCPECGNEDVRIPRMLQLLESIGEFIVTKRPVLEAQDIVYLRKGMGMKAKEFADLLGVDPALYSRWENGKTSPGTANERLIRLTYAVSKELKSIGDLAKFFPEADEEYVRDFLRAIVTDGEYEMEAYAAA